jgi:acetyltransferase-like isoleucine patch superfamily enzyme
LAIGSNAFVGQGSVITAAAQLTIGSDALIASGVVIRDQDHGTGRPRRLQALVSSPVSIGQNVWIGANAVVLKGVKIGDNALIGAGAVVTRDIPADAVAVGVPAVILPDRRA